MQKTNKNKNERLSQSKVVGGGAAPPQLQSCGGKLPTLPPPPPVPASLWHSYLADAPAPTSEVGIVIARGGSR